MRIEHFIRKIHRLRLVGLHIDLHLDDPLRLDDLSDIACLSRHQFVREFAAYAGETPIARLRRLRLERARRDLLNGVCDNLLELAFTSGYNSAEAFSRAFSNQYGLPPSRLPAQIIVPQAPIRIVHLPDLAIQYLPYRGRARDGLIVHDELRAMAIDAGIARARRKGIVLRPPQDYRGWDAPTEFLTGLLSTPLGKRIPGLQSTLHPGGDHALLCFHGHFRTPPQAELARRIEEETGRRMAGSMQIHKSRNSGYLPAAELDNRFELYIPLEPA